MDTLYFQKTIVDPKKVVIPEPHIKTGECSIIDVKKDTRMTQLFLNADPSVVGSMEMIDCKPYLRVWEKDPDERPF